MADGCSEHSYPAGTAFVDPGRGMVHSAYNPTDGETVIVATFTRCLPTARCRSPRGSPPPPTTAACRPLPPADRPARTDGRFHDGTVMRTPIGRGCGAVSVVPDGARCRRQGRGTRRPQRVPRPHGSAAVGRSSSTARRGSASRHCGGPPSTSHSGADCACSPRGRRKRSTHLAFSGIGDLFEDVVDEVFPSLPPARRHAMEAALLLGEPVSSVDPSAPSRIAVRDTLTLTAATAPTVVAVDDVQWLDESSSNALSFAWRRLSAPVLLVLARRGKRGDASELEHAVPPNQVECLDVGPLTLGALQELLRTRLDRVFTRPTLLRIHAISGGNPFYTIEIARALDEHVDPAQPLPFPRPSMGSSSARPRPAAREHPRRARARGHRRRPDVGAPARRRCTPR